MPRITSSHTSMWSFLLSLITVLALSSVAFPTADASAVPVLQSYGGWYISSIAVDDSGVVYAAANQLGRILRVDSTGAQLSPFVLPASSSGTPYNPCGVTIGAVDRQVYALSCQQPNVLLTLSKQNGSVLRSLNLSTNSNISSALLSATTLAVGSSSVWMVNNAPYYPYSGLALQYDLATGALLRVWQPDTYSVRQYSGVAVSASDDVIVCDPYNSYVYILNNRSDTNPNGTVHRYGQRAINVAINVLTGDLFFTAPGDSNTLNRNYANGSNTQQQWSLPSGHALGAISVDSQRNVVWAVDQTTYALQRFSLANTSQVTTVPLGYVLWSPVTFALTTLNTTAGAQTSALLVADQNSVRVFDVHNTTVEYVPFSPLSYPPTGLAAANGLVFVSEWNAKVGVVEVFNATTRALVYTITTTSPALTNPRGVAVGSDGTVFVCDTGNNRVVKFVQTATAPSPKWRQEVVLTGTNPELYQPTAATLNSQTKQLYVTDNNGRIVQFNAMDGSQASVIVQPYSDQLVAPTSLAQDASGNFYTVSADNSIAVFSSSGALLTKLNNGTGPTSSYPWSTPVSVALDSSSKLWVLDGAMREVFVVAAPSLPSSPPDSSSNSAYAASKQAYTLWLVLLLATVFTVLTLV